MIDKSFTLFFFMQSDNKIPSKVVRVLRGHRGRVNAVRYTSNSGG